MVDFVCNTVILIAFCIGGTLGLWSASVEEQGIAVMLHSDIPFIAGMAVGNFAVVDATAPPEAIQHELGHVAYTQKVGIVVSSLTAGFMSTLGVLLYRVGILSCTEYNLLPTEALANELGGLVNE